MHAQSHITNAKRYNMITKEQRCLTYHRLSQIGVVKYSATFYVYLQAHLIPLLYLYRYRLGLMTASVHLVAMEIAALTIGMSRVYLSASPYYQVWVVHYQACLLRPSAAQQ